MAETSKSGAENLPTLVSILWFILRFQMITFLRTYFTYVHEYVNGIIFIQDTRYSLFIRKSIKDIRNTIE